ncbi:MAG: hypothetical protein AAGH89_18700 [Verrucomicrobiota bacterium]
MNDVRKLMYEKTKDASPEMLLEIIKNMMEVQPGTIDGFRLLCLAFIDLDGKVDEDVVE